MDIFGIDLKAKRAEVKVVMLTTKNQRAWLRGEVNLLVGRLKPMAVITTHPYIPASP